MKRVILKVSEVERTVIVAALMQYGFNKLAGRLSIPSDDASDDGPEVKILNSEAPAPPKMHQCTTLEDISTCPTCSIP